jgi:putative hydrolase
VASVHSKLRAPSEEMTPRMVAAIAEPAHRRARPLHRAQRHAAGPARATRPESEFDAEVVFEACRRFGVAVEINCRPERWTRQAAAAARAGDGCDFSVDTDAHAPGSWTGSRTAASGLPRAGAGRADRQHRPVEDLLACDTARAGMTVRQSGCRNNDVFG